VPFPDGSGKSFSRLAKFRHLRRKLISNQSLGAILHRHPAAEFRRGFGRWQPNGSGIQQRFFEGVWSSSKFDFDN